MRYLQCLFATLILLPLLVGCLAGDAADPTATLEPTAAGAKATTAVTSTPVAETPESAELTSTLTPTSEPTPDPILPPPASTPMIVFDATPTTVPTPTVTAPKGVPYELVETFGQPILPQAPADVFVLADGNIALADAGRGEIQIFAADQTVLDSWSTLALRHWDDGFTNVIPLHVVESGGSYYVAFSPVDSLVHYPEDGGALAQHNFGDVSLTLFDLAAGPDGRIYAAAGSFSSEPVSDEFPFGIYVFDRELNLVEVWAAEARRMPLALDFDDDGVLHALVLSSNLSNGGREVSRNAEIITIDPAAYDAAAWENSTEFELEGRFNGLTVTAEGNYVLIAEATADPEDDAATTVYLVTPEGDEINSWEVAGHAAAVNRTSAGVGLRSTAAGELIVLADPIGQRVLFFRPDGTLAEVWQAASGDLAVPSSIDLNDAGELAVLDVPAGSVSIFGPDRAEAVRHKIDVLRPHPTFGVTGRMFYGHEDDIWYIDYNAASPFSLYRLDLMTGDIEQFATDTILDDDPIPVIFDPVSGAAGDDGRLYLAIEGDETGSLWSFDMDGAGFEVPLSDHDDYFVGAVFDVTTGPDGIYTLWRGRIDDQWGTFVSIVASGARETAEVSVVKTFGPLAPGPRAIAVGEDHMMYLLDPLASAIDILRPDRTHHAIWSVRLYEDRQITDIAVDQRGQVYLSDVLQHEVLVYAPVTE